MTENSDQLESDDELEDDDDFDEAEFKAKCQEFLKWMREPTVWDLDIPCPKCKKMKLKQTMYFMGGPGRVKCSGILCFYNSSAYNFEASMVFPAIEALLAPRTSKPENEGE